MATNENTVGRSVKTGLDIIVGVLVIVAIIYVALPFVKVPVLGDMLTPQQTIKVQPTRERYQPILPIRTGADTSAAPAIPGVAQNAATAQAMYDAAVQAGEQAAPVLDNVDLTNDAAPVQRVQVESERQPAGDNVPTAEPVQQAESGGIFGSKPALVNPQETHECKHGQVWIEGKGCKNP